MRSRTTRLIAAAAAAALVLTTAACGGDDAEGADGMRKITVGIVPTVDLAPFRYAIDEGLFEEQGLDVETRVTAGGAESIPALLAGDVDFIYTSYIPVLLAKQKGLPVMIATGSHTNTAGQDSPSGLWTRPDSGIETLADLEGKTISVNSLGSSAELMVVAAMEEIGLDRDDYEMLEVPFPEVAAALDQGNIDAGWVAEPGRATVLGELGGRFVGSAEDPTVMTTAAELQDMPMAGYGTRADEDPEVVEGFYTAMSEALEVVGEDPEIARDLAKKHLEIDDALVPQLAVSDFGPVAQEDLQRLADLMLEYGLVDEPIGDLDGLVYQP